MSTARVFAIRNRITAPASIAAAAVVAAVALGGCHFLDHTVFPNPPLHMPLANFSTSDTLVWADNATVVELTAVLDPSAAAGGATVTFASTAGTMLPAGGSTNSVVVPADSTDTVRAQLRAPADTAIALVTATCLGTTRTLTVAFRRAPPTLIEVVPAAATVAAGAGNSLSVTVQLLRRFGAPSPGWSITLAATDPLDTVRGRFSANNVFASSNSVTVAYTSPDSTYLGPVVLTATANGVSGSATILVTHAK